MFINRTWTGYNDVTVTQHKKVRKRMLLTKGFRRNLENEFQLYLSPFLNIFRFPHLQFQYRDPEARFDRSKVGFHAYNSSFWFLNYHIRTESLVSPDVAIINSTFGPVKILKHRQAKSLRYSKCINKQIPHQQMCFVICTA